MSPSICASGGRKEKQHDWHTMTDETRDAPVEECVAAVAESYGNTILGSSARNRYLARRVGQITKRTIWACSSRSKGDFVPAGFEISFSAADNLSAMKIALSEKKRSICRGGLTAWMSVRMGKGLRQDYRL